MKLYFSENHLFLTVNNKPYNTVNNLWVYVVNNIFLTQAVCLRISTHNGVHLERLRI